MWPCLEEKQRDPMIPPPPVGLWGSGVTLKLNKGPVICVFKQSQ